ncbi:hypothetical protein U9M48_033992 [Paspalum notatum var. saurae]|uniref:non-specific serine/threonine protein kinase n=1 Tax=Paspalum notatum var. saurae TaxID=547442 RepID=A0AAQ3X6E6_PASNO
MSNAKLRHANLVSLLAYCDQGNERALLYEYMQNKSLDIYIFGIAPLTVLVQCVHYKHTASDLQSPYLLLGSSILKWKLELAGKPRTRASLNWPRRLDIIHGIARGVWYLHEGSGENVIHRDLKPSNVLLDQSWKPKIADFGTAKLFLADQTGTQTVVVSPGYASPEYAKDGDMTLKCDVFSFGVVLLEVVSGRRNSAQPSLLSHCTPSLPSGSTCSDSDSRTERKVILQAWKLWEEHRVMDLLDPTVPRPRSDDTELLSELRRCIQIGLLCVQWSPGDRLAMSAALAMLTSRTSHLDPPRRTVLHSFVSLCAMVFLVTSASVMLSSFFGSTLAEEEERRTVAARIGRGMEMEAKCSLVNLLLLLLPLIAFAAGVADTLGKGGNITGDETLVSADGTFTMGFFSLGSSTATKRYYLGIWFSVSSDAVCWVANSERPLPDKAGVLLISDTGSLVLRDSSGRTAWSSSSSTTSSSVVAQLLDTGNLVVRDQGAGGGTALSWQSFDHPSNTLLSGMKVGKDFWNGAEWHLTSWKAADDPSPGLYRRVLDTSGLPDFVLYHSNVTTYRTGPWNGRSFSGATEVLGYENLVTLSVTMSPGDEVSYRYTAEPGVLTRLVVMDTGVVKRFVWSNTSQGWGWHTVFQGPRDLCDGYGKCGAFGLCDASSVLAPCGCLPGFSPASPSSWNTDPSGGCRRKAALQCGSGGTTDGFLLVRGVKLPDTHDASVDMDITVKECERRCRANCSCLAYAAADIRGGGGGTGCVIWTDDVVDLRYVERGQDLYLRLAKSELDKKFPLAAVVAPAAFVVAALAFFLLIWWRTKATKRNAPADGPRSPTMNDCSLDLPTVKMATGDFSQSNVIGEGGFAVVYKGELPDGRSVAVKRLKQSVLADDKGKKDFAREVDVMANVRHANLLRLLAYCNEGGERILIYAFMPNKSLDLYIFGKPSDRARLNWRQRLDIIHGVAHGVAYLHQGSEESVVHRDLKPSNVLLDDNWKPKIADFNTAKLFITDQPDATIVVSPGYTSPEYLRGEMMPKCDVYSFGVIVLETLSGQRNGPMKRVISNAREFWRQDRVMALLDSTVALPVSPPGSEISTELERYVRIGLLCVQEAPESRPDMSAVVAMLTTRNPDTNLLLRAA